nr:hypothetical protein CFP56_57133 [Quercus suber]
MFHGWAKHLIVEEPDKETRGKDPHEKAQFKGQVVIESVDSSSKGLEIENPNLEMCETASRVPLASPTTPLVIRESGLGPQIAVEVGSNKRPLRRLLLLDGHAFRLLNEVQYFAEGSNKVVAFGLQWHTIAEAQLAFMLEDKVKSSAVEIEKERAFKEVAEATMQEKGKTLDAAVEKAHGQSMRALVEEINAHAELIDLELLSDPNVDQGQAPQPIPNPDLQSTKGAIPCIFDQSQEPTV